MNTFKNYCSYYNFSIAFGVQNVHLSPSLKLYADHTAHYTQSSVYQYHAYA